MLGDYGSCSRCGKAHTLPAAMPGVGPSYCGACWREMQPATPPEPSAPVTHENAAEVLTVEAERLGMYAPEPQPPPTHEEMRGRASRFYEEHYDTLQAWRTVRALAALLATVAAEARAAALEQAAKECEEQVAHLGESFAAQEMSAFVTGARCARRIRALASGRGTK